MGAAVWYYRAPHGGAWRRSPRHSPATTIAGSTTCRAGRRRTSRRHRRARAARHGGASGDPPDAAGCRRRSGAAKGGAEGRGDPRRPRGRSHSRRRRCAATSPTYAPEAALALSFMGSAAVPTLRDAVTDPTSRSCGARRCARWASCASARRSIRRSSSRCCSTRSTIPTPSVRTVAVTYLGIVRDSPDARRSPGLIKALADAERRGAPGRRRRPRRLRRRSPSRRFPR